MGHLTSRKVLSKTGGELSYCSTGEPTLSWFCRVLNGFCNKLEGGSSCSCHVLISGLRRFTLTLVELPVLLFARSIGLINGFPALTVPYGAVLSNTAKNSGRSRT